MKAQSELTGDRERAAEMTAPRVGGVTNWREPAQKDEDLQMKIANSIPQAGPDDSEEAALQAALGAALLEDNDTVPPEVSIARPASNGRPALRKFGENLSAAPRGAAPCLLFRRPRRLNSNFVTNGNRIKLASRSKMW